MKRFAIITGAAMFLAMGAHAQLGVTMTAKTSFKGDGWFAPGEGGYTFLGTGSFERGIAYNPANNHLYVVSRNGGVNVRILDGNSGTDLGNMNATGVSGGSIFAANMAGCDNAGNLYVANLSSGAGFKVYKWADESGSAPVVVPTGSNALARVGDTFDVDGPTGNFISSGSGVSGYVSIAGGVATTQNPAGTAVGDFRLGLTYISGTTILGTQGAAGNKHRYCDLTTGTLLGSITPASASERLLDYAVVGGYGLLATCDTINSLVRIYDMTNPLAPNLRASFTTTSGTLVANGNGVGQVKWGKIVGNKATLYAMSTNQGIQAIEVAVPEPGSIAALALGGLFLVSRRRKA